MKAILQPQFSILVATLAALTQLSTFNPEPPLAQTPLPDSFNPGVDGAVYLLAVQADGRILVGGDFTTVGGQTRKYIGRLNAGSTLDIDTGSGAGHSPVTPHSPRVEYPGAIYHVMTGRSPARV